MKVAREIPLYHYLEAGGAEGAKCTESGTPKLSGQRIVTGRISGISGLYQGVYTTEIESFISLLFYGGS